MDSSSSKVTALDEKDDLEKVTDKTSSTSISYHHLYPCDLLEEAVRALLKCFGLDNKFYTAAGEEPQPETSTGAKAAAKTDPSTPEFADPSEPTDEVAAAAAADPPPSSVSETTEIAAVSVIRAARPIGTGRGPQIN